MHRWLLLLTLAAPAIAAADWFDDLKAEPDPTQLYRALHSMPKGGDLHNHLSGSGFAEWWYDLALASEAHGYRYYTKVRIENCGGYGSDQFGGAPYYLMFRNITARQYEALDECERREYLALADLDDRQLAGWLDSIRLDQAHEGRDEFFQTHWQRLNALTADPWLQAEMLYRHLRALADEGIVYVEPQVPVSGFRWPDGTALSSDETAEILRRRLAERDVRDTGVTARLQVPVLRFVPGAEDALRDAYRFVHDNRDLYVAVNLVGREDNDKGYPLRFLDTLRDLRRRYGGVRLSIHGGEVDEPNAHVRDTLLLGAERIGHGVNLIGDGDTMLLMRYGHYLVEINLISNLLLGYVDDYADHPFPEYLRTGIPVALSTDDRGMWDSTMTDEFYVAVREFNLSWDEVVTLSRNSLQYAFADEPTKRRLLDDFAARIERFETSLQKYGTDRLGPMPATRGFICDRYSLCVAAGQ